MNYIFQFAYVPVLAGRNKAGDELLYGIIALDGLEKETEMQSEALLTRDELEGPNDVMPDDGSRLSDSKAIDSPHHCPFLARTRF
jgi:hypothetical protein